MLAWAADGEASHQTKNSMIFHCCVTKITSSTHKSEEAPHIKIKLWKMLVIKTQSWYF